MSDISSPVFQQTDATHVSDYVLPTVYAGPTLTLLPASTINSTHINAIFRCQVRPNLPESGRSWP